MYTEYLDINQSTTCTVNIESNGVRVVFNTRPALLWTNS